VRTLAVNSSIDAKRVASVSGGAQRILRLFMVCIDISGNSELTASVI